MAEEINKLGLHELIEKDKLTDTDIFVVQDDENTKQVSFRNLRDSLIDDNELPSQHRLYSSQKLNEAIENFQKQLDYDIGKVENEISKIAQDYISPEDVDKKIEEFSKTVPTLSETETLKQALGTKRDSSVLINCNDLDTSSDEMKIQVKNLSNSVIAAMTGTTAITPPAVPEGGWVQEDIANYSINGAKLATQYRYRGHYPDGNINNFTRDGLYLLGSSVEGLPKYKEDEADEDRLLEVFNYGPDNYIIQKVYYALDSGEDVRPYYERKSLLNTLHISKFVAKYEVTNKFKITRNILEDNVLDMGEITEGDLFKITTDGDYFVNKGVKNLPNTEDDFTVSVRKYNDHIEYVAKAIDLDKCEIYICNKISNLSTEWYLTNTVTKSRLDGKRLHLFGDGICFGLGSSNIPELAYPALLSSRYGLRIVNHALGDATIGEYGDAYLSERSVIKQIENANITNGDFAIIFAGSNDYKSAASRIGINTDKTNYYFKGALNICIQKLLEKNSSIKILVVTPLFRARLDADDFRNSDDTPVNQLYLKDFTNAMKEICEYNHVPCLDLHSNGMINRYNYKSYLSDGLYLNDAGHDMVANKIFSALVYFY